MLSLHQVSFTQKCVLKTSTFFRFVIPDEESSKLVSSRGSPGKMRIQYAGNNQQRGTQRGGAEPWLSILGSESVAVRSDCCYCLGFPVSVYSKVSGIILIFLTGPLQVILSLLRVSWVLRTGAEYCCLPCQEQNQVWEGAEKIGIFKKSCAEVKSVMFGHFVSSWPWILGR